MDSADYLPLGEYVMPVARLFVKEADNIRLCNVHVFQKNHPHAKEMLRLRDYLSDHPKLVNEYSRLKLDLYRMYPDDYGSYRKYKDAWMKKVKTNIRKGPTNNK